MSLHPVGMDIAEHIRTDPEAGTRRLMAEQGAALYAVALRLCGGNPTEADDLYVRTLERAVDRIAEQQGPHFFAWLSAICTNLHRQGRRRKALPLASDEELASIPDNGPTPLGELIARSDGRGGMHRGGPASRTIPRAGSPALLGRAFARRNRRRARHSRGNGAAASLPGPRPPAGRTRKPL